MSAANTYRLTVSTPDGNRFRDEVYGLYLRGCEGELAVLRGHVHFITSVAAGEIRIELEDSTEKKARTEGGLLTVAPEGVTLLVGEFSWIEE